MRKAFGAFSVKGLTRLTYRSSTFRAMIAEPGELQMRSTVYFSCFSLIFFPSEVCVDDQVSGLARPFRPLRTFSLARDFNFLAGRVCAIRLDHPRWTFGRSSLCWDLGGSFLRARKFAAAGKSTAPCSAWRSAMLANKRAAAACGSGMHCRMKQADTRSSG